MSRLISKHPDIAKTISYSIMHMVVAFAVAYILSRSVVVALGIGLIEPMVQTIAYHFHEKAWTKESIRRA